MESRPKNPEFRNNPENFHLCTSQFKWSIVFRYSENKSVMLL